MRQADRRRFYFAGARRRMVRKNHQMTSLTRTQGRRGLQVGARGAAEREASARISTTEDRGLHGGLQVGARVATEREASAERLRSQKLEV